MQKAYGSYDMFMTHTRIRRIQMGTCAKDQHAGEWMLIPKNMALQVLNNPNIGSIVFWADGAAWF